MLQERKDREVFCDYVGQHLWDIDNVLRGFGGGENDMPQYIEISHPETKQKQMTAEEIKQRTLALLG